VQRLGLSCAARAKRHAAAARLTPTLGRTLPAQIAVLVASQCRERGRRRSQCCSASLAVSVGRAVRGVGAGRPVQAQRNKVGVSQQARRLGLSCQPGCAEQSAQVGQLVEPRRIGRGRLVGGIECAAQFRQEAGRPVAGGTAGAAFRCSRARPNTSFKRTRNGMALGPCNALVYRAPHGPSAMPLRPA
jgi:hypothetical protein